MITVIVPVYDVQPYLDTCIRSIVSQSYNQLEILLIDDGSHDGSSGLCDRWTMADRRILTIHKHNEGLSAARNTGLEMGIGEYCCFIDSDDWIEPTILQDAVNIMMREDSDVLVWGYSKDTVSLKGKLLLQQKYGISGTCSPNTGFRQLLYGNGMGIAGYAWNKLYRKDLIEMKKFRFEEGLSLIEDIVFNAAVLCECRKAVFIERIGTHYMQRERETLGTRFYDDYLQLTLRAIEGKCSLLQHYGADVIENGKYRGKEYIAALRSSVRIISALPEKCKERIKKIRQLAVDAEELGLLDQVFFRSLGDRIVVLLLARHCFWSLVVISGIRNCMKLCKNIIVSICLWIKNCIPLDLKQRVRLLLSETDRKWSSLPDSDTQKIFVFLAGFYRNLGDLAITYAQKKFLRKCFPESTVFLIPEQETYVAVKAIRTFIRAEDLVVLSGGGNMCDQYYHLETARRHVIRSFKRNKIISFPQTMFFTDTRIGKKELQRSRKIYRAHSNLVLSARDKTSLRSMKDAFPNCDVIHMPDIVLTLHYSRVLKERKGILICFRSDLESEITAEQYRELISYASSVANNIAYMDTVDVDIHKCNELLYEEEIEKILDLIASKKCVLTDRLHCMLFCAITGTPCVAMDNSTHKVSGVYRDWLRSLQYIEVPEQTDRRSIIHAIERTMSHADETMPLEAVRKEFDRLRQACLER